MEDPVQEKTISTGTAARVTGIPIRTLRQGCQERKIPSYKFGKRWRILRDQFFEQLKRQMDRDDAN